MVSMLAQRPYLLKSLYNWIVDSECTPHIIVDATEVAVQVPHQFVEDGKIVLNIAPLSVDGFSMDDDAVAFNARFGGQPMQIYVPIFAIEGIYAQENGAGTMFVAEPVYDALKKSKAMQPEQIEKQKRPVFTIVK